MDTFSALLAICAGNSPITGKFPAQRPVTRSFDVFFDLRLNKRLSKQWWSRWFETPSRPLWLHSNVCSCFDLLVYFSTTQGHLGSVHEIILQICICVNSKASSHRRHRDDVIKWKYFPSYWPFVRGIPRSPVDPLTKASDVEPWCFLLSEQTVEQTMRCRWFETPSCSLWSHCYDDSV